MSISPQTQVPMLSNLLIAPQRFDLAGLTGLFPFSSSCLREAEQRAATLGKTHIHAHDLTP